MCNRFLTMFVIAGCLVFFNLSAVIQPGDLTNITENETVGSIVIVAGAQDGFMATWNSTSAVAVSGFSNNLGESWTNHNIGSSEVINSWVAGNQSGFVAAWLKHDDGFVIGSVYTSFSSNQGQTWSSFVSLGGSAESLVAVAANNAGYVVSWHNTCADRAYVDFSSDGINWQGSQAISGNTNNVTTPVMVAGSNLGFMTAWQENNSSDLNGYVSYSSNGTVWGVPVQISAMTNLRERNVITVGATAAGFMLAWIDNDSHSFSSFSADNGQTWTTPVQISDSHSVECGFPIVSIGGSSFGFVTSWINGNGRPVASLSLDNGATWQTPVDLSNGGSLVVQDSQYATVGVSVVGNYAMFTWQDESNNAISCYALLGESLLPVTNLKGKHLLNRFVNYGEYFNTLSWVASVSEVTNYLIYRNGILIATLPPSQLIYEDHNQSHQVSYEVVAVNGNAESDAVSITL